MNKNLEKRLAELEVRIGRAGERLAWIDGRNARVRVDIGRRRGQEIEFPSVVEARQWIEKQLDSHAGGVLSFIVDNICDLFEDGHELRECLQAVLGGPVVVPQTSGQEIGGQVQPLVFDPGGSFPVILALTRVSPGMTADIRLWAVAHIIRLYCGGREFRARWVNGDHSDDDNRMLLALWVLYAWKRPKPAFRDFARLFYQVTELPPPGAPGSPLTGETEPMGEK